MIVGGFGIQRSADAAVINVYPSEVQGLYQTATSDGPIGSYYVGSTAGQIDRKFFKFILPAEIGDNSNIVSAVLNVAQFNPSGSLFARPVVEYLPNDSWTADTITWANQPAPAGAAYDLPVPPGAFWTIGASPDLSAELSENGGDAVSLRLRGNIEDPQQVVYSYIHPGAGNVYLTIDYVPEPSSAALLLIALPLVRRRRRG